MYIIILSFIIFYNFEYARYDRLVNNNLSVRD